MWNKMRSRFPEGSILFTIRWIEARWMPYPKSAELRIQITAHTRAYLKDPEPDRDTKNRNHLIYVADGYCEVRVSGKRLRIGQRGLLYLPRNMRYSIASIDKSKCLVFFLEIVRAEDRYDLDLQALCVRNASVDAFMATKNAACILVDCENMYITLGELFNELDSDKAEKSQMVESLMITLFIKMARSYLQHNKPNGIQYITSAKKFIAEHCEDELSAQMIADHLGISRSYLHILFARYANRSVVTHINVVRIDKAAFLLTTTGMSVVDVAMSTGFANRQHFSRVFKQYSGLSPREFRKRSGQIRIDDLREKLALD
jgi:AraC family transcriptional regulator, melibiose operon regulatory protein